MLVAEAVKEAEDDFFVAVPDVHALNVAGVGERQAREAVGEEAEGWAVDGFAGALEDYGQGARGQRVDVIHVTNAYGFVVTFDLDLIGGKDFAVLIAEDGYEDFVLEPYFRGVPVDVEPGGKSAGRAVLEDVPPIFILRADGHVVGNDVEDLTEAEFSEASAETLMSFFAAEFGVDALMIDDVVAVHAAGSGLQIGRAIDMRDTERLEIGSDPYGVVECEAGVQLQTVSGVGNSGHISYVGFALGMGGKGWKRRKEFGCKGEDARCFKLAVEAEVL
jgi:hypothetical protein